jgi:hypothetical protein
VGSWWDRSCGGAHREADAGETSGDGEVASDGEADTGETSAGGDEMGRTTAWDAKMGRTTAHGGMRRWGGRRRPRAAPVERVPTAGGGQGRAGGGQRLKEVFLDLCGRREPRGLKGPIPD